MPRPAESGPERRATEAAQLELGKRAAAEMAFRKHKALERLSVLKNSKVSEPLRNLKPGGLGLHLEMQADPGGEEEIYTGQHSSR